MKISSLLNKMITKTTSITRVRSGLMPLFGSLITLFLLDCTSNAYTQEIHTGTIIREMADLKKLAEYPSPMYKTIQYSSYDRRSTFPDAPGWFENSDGFGGEPVPGFEKVLKAADSKGIGEYQICDVEGPGAIVRLWTAAINGTIRLYLDGKPDPVYNGSAYEFFTNTYRAMVPQADIPVEGSFTQNMAGYYPLPFARRCRMVWAGDIKDLHFYHVNVRLYEKGTKVKTFHPDDLITYKADIQKVHQAMTDPRPELNTGVSLATPFAATVAGGEEKEVLNLSGSKGILLFEMKVVSNDVINALRQTVLRISFDGSSIPQVQSPVGDFFGTAQGLNPYRSLPLTVTEDGTMQCRFYMPFKEKASVVIENLGDREVSVTGKVVSEPYVWNHSQSMYFRAYWKVDHDLLASYERPSDITFLETTGKGVCVGAAVHLMNPSDVPSVYGNWWGEGDEKIFVDNDLSPVFIGTGSEDYFNYAWSSPDLFDYAYCGQPRCDGVGTRGFVTNYRWHILDNVPFQNQFAFYMELLSHEPVPGFSYARIIYHYGFTGMHADYHRISKGDVRPLQLPDRWYPVGKKGSANCRFYQAEDLIAQADHISLSPDRLWSGGQLVEWIPDRIGEKLTFRLPIPQEGTYTVYLTVRQNRDSGSVTAKINDAVYDGEKGVINLKTTRGILSRAVNSSQLKLQAGEQILTLESLEAGKPIGIDFIWIQKNGR